MSIETNWNFIIQKAAADYYTHLPGGTQTISQEQVSFLDYNALAKAVSMMKKKDDNLICGSGCKDIVRRVWEQEKDFFAKNNLTFSEDVSAVKKIAAGLIATLKFTDARGEPLTIDSSNLFRDDIQKFFGFNQGSVLKQSGGTQRRSRRSAAHGALRGESTRRLSRRSRKK